MIGEPASSSFSESSSLNAAILLTIRSFLAFLFDKSEMRHNHCGIMMLFSLSPQIKSMEKALARALVVASLSCNKGLYHS